MQRENRRLLQSITRIITRGKGSDRDPTTSTFQRSLIEEQNSRNSRSAMSSRRSSSASQTNRPKSLSLEYKNKVAQQIAYENNVSP